MSDVSPPGDHRPGRGGRPRDPSRDGAIRAAILEVLARSGYSGLTMDAVAAAAGVGKATIYRRWRTKSDLVADAVAQLSHTPVEVPDTGSLEGDLRELLRWLVDTVNGPIGGAIRALLSALSHEPALRTAFHEGPLALWGAAFGEVWDRAVQRGELGVSMTGTAVAATASAPILQCWLFHGEPVPREFADEVVADVVLPLITARRPAA
ncbi:TetR/AcrR family transcriptional regulator [Modestobacter marinus]|uniref:TetR/AcrR family transcriptional regulator n=1 Tax=Modestobacter marinus TaxID=477641 RepID=UPI001C9731FF|nr:TetR-like C-terminal domain-containing protein [Modestobacter marinus]